MPVWGRSRPAAMGGVAVGTGQGTGARSRARSSGKRGGSGPMGFARMGACLAVLGALAGVVRPGGSVRTRREEEVRGDLWEEDGLPATAGVYAKEMRFLNEWLELRGVGDWEALLRVDAKLATSWVCAYIEAG